jgi:predicted ABC-type transport system involved in lysophospholipase L1 biosynthesis ATPase subunit
LASKISAFADAAPELTPASAAPVISVQNLVHRYENRTALNGVSFDVRPAELFGLLGPNGSGKTTLFRILSTLMIPSAGRATIMGCDAAQEPARLRRQIGVVFQAQSVDLKLTAYENLWHQGHLYGLRGAALKNGFTKFCHAWAWRIAPKSWLKHSPAGCSAASSWARDCFIILACCCWMNPLRASIRARGAISGNICKCCATKNMFPCS